MFLDREGKYNSRGKFNLKKCCVHISLKSVCISICGVTLWNGLDVELKQIKSIQRVKQMSKELLFERFRAEERALFLLRRGRSPMMRMVMMLSLIC